MKYLIIFLFFFTLACTSQPKDNKTNQTLKWILRLNGINK